MNNNDPLIQALLAQMTQDNGMGGLQQELGAYDAMGPEGYKQHVGMGTLDQRGQLSRQNAVDQAGLLEQQQAIARALATPKNKNYGTVGGNIAGGIGDALGAFFGGRQMAGLGEQQKALMSQGNSEQRGFLDQQDAGRLNSGNARFSGMRNFLADALRKQQPAAKSGEWSGMAPTEGLPPALTDDMQFDMSAFGAPPKPKVARQSSGLPPPSFFGM